MLNAVELVGEIVAVTPKGDTSFLLKVIRDYKETDGYFYADKIRCRLWKDSMGSYMKSYQVGQMINLSGRLVSDNQTGLCMVVVEKMDYVGRISPTQEMDGL